MITIRVIGKVQGVAFRYYTKLKADELGIVGTVQNLDNGNVLINAKANSQKLDAFIDWCYEGSPASDVENVIVDRDQYTKPSMDIAPSTANKLKFVILRH